MHLFACPYNVSLSCERRYKDKKYSVVALFDTYNHYPAVPLSRYDIKLYFFQIVKERELHLSKVLDLT